MEASCLKRNLDLIQARKFTVKPPKLWDSMCLEKRFTSLMDSRWWTRGVTLCPESIRFYFCSVCCHPRPVIVFPNISKRVASIMKGFTWKFDICLVLVRCCGKLYSLAQVLVLWFSCSTQSSAMILDAILVYWNVIMSWHGSNQIIATGLPAWLAVHTCSFFRK